MILLLVAHASASCMQSPAWVSPADGAEDVPLDVRVMWGTSSWSDGAVPVVTTALDGAEVATTITWTETGAGTRYATIVPDAPLLPFTAYRVADQWDAYTFTTGETTGSEAPAAPVMTVAETSADFETTSRCDGTSVSVSGQEHVYALLTPEAVPDGFFEARVSVDGGEEIVVYGGAAVSLAWGSCRRSTLPRDEDAQHMEVRTRAVSWTGEVSDWSAPVEVDVPWPEEPVCPPAECGSGPGLFAGLPLLVGLGWRRRKR